MFVPNTNKQQNINSLYKILQFDELVGYLNVQLSLLPDMRQGFNTKYSMQDAGLSAFSVFFMQSPSFLSHQKHLEETTGQNNAASLFKIEQIMSDNHVRNLLDPVSPAHLNPVYMKVYDSLDESGFIEPYCCLEDSMLIALDGVCYHSSNQIYCDKCYQREHKDGVITYSHSAITPVIVAPDNPQVISLPPEFITPQDGHNKQDSEHAAAKRWISTHAKHYQPKGVTFLGDDLYSHQPLCQAILDADCNFLFTCKPDSHKILYEHITGLSKLNTVESLTRQRRKGKKIFTDTYRFINQVPLRDGEDSILVNWCELITTNHDDKVIYKNTFVTNHIIHHKNIIDMVKAGRARWKIENENNNTLKTKGYNLEHNFGHGSQYLSQLLLTMNLLAFLYHTVLHLADRNYEMIRDKLPTRKTFFDDIRALTRYMYFNEWSDLMKFMMKGLKLQYHNNLDSG